MGDFLIYFLAAYLLGSIPFGWLVARARGVNIREVGSGNIGATNVGRALGRPYAILVFILDFLKGFLPTFLVVHQWSTPSPAQLCGSLLVALFAMLGHIFPVWLKFRGGKGIATGAGALAALLPVPVLVAAGVWFLFFSVTRYVSVASLAAAVSLPITTFLADMSPIYLAFTLLIMILAFYTHRSNIIALLQGRENRFTRKE